MNKKLKTVLSLMLAVMLAMMFSMQAFAVSNADVKAAVERQVVLDSEGNIPQDSALKTYIHPGTIAGGAGDLQLEIGGKPFYIEQSDINTVYGMVSNSGSDDTAVKADQAATAQNQLDKIQEMNKITPNYDRASEILSPFMPYVNALLGIVTTIVVTVMSLLTALDLCYIAIPALRNFMNDNPNQHKGGDVNNEKLRFISDEAQYAVKVTVGGEGGAGGAGGNIGNGAFKSPWGVYFKTRIVSYIFLAVAITILLTGNITIITNLAIKLVGGLMNVLQSLSH